MKSFFYEPVRRLEYVSALLAERRSLAEFIAPELYDFFDHSDVEERQHLNLKNSDLLAHFWECMEGRKPEAWFEVIRITLYIAPRWKFFQVDVDKDGGSVGLYEGQAYLLYFNDDVDALQYKLKFK